MARGAKLAVDSDQTRRLRGARPRGLLRDRGGARARHRRHRLHAGRQREEGEVLQPALRARRASSPRAASSVSASPTRAASTTRSLVPGRGPLHPDRLLQHAQHHHPDQDAVRRRRRASYASSAARSSACGARTTSRRPRTSRRRPQVGKHDDAEFGTHHAHDASTSSRPWTRSLDLFSSAVKLNTQYMHSIWFDLAFNRDITKEEMVERLRGNLAGRGDRQAQLPTRSSASAATTATTAGSCRRPSSCCRRSRCAGSASSTASASRRRTATRCSPRSRPRSG